MSDGDRNIIPVDPTAPFKLGRHQWHDPRNRLWAAASVVDLDTEPKARPRPWFSSVTFDQLNTSSCDAQMAVGLCRTQPLTRRWVRKFFRGYDEHLERVALYITGQGVDPWPGSEITEPRYEGTSTDACPRVLRDRGQIVSYRWLFGFQQVRRYLKSDGPVGVGTVWKGDMFRPDPDGTIHAMGSVVGGHAYRLVYADDKNQRVMGVNSWGEGWARRGRFWLSYADMEALLGEGGEALVIEEPHVQ